MGGGRFLRTERRGRGDSAFKADAACSAIIEGFVRGSDEWIKLAVDPLGPSLRGLGNLSRRPCRDSLGQRFEEEIRTRRRGSFRLGSTQAARTRNLIGEEVPEKWKNKQ